MDYISALEQALGVEAEKNFMDLQLGDVKSTNAEMKRLFEWVNFNPNTPINEGIRKFVEWYRLYYKL